jgi:thymidylate synthase
MLMNNVDKQYLELAKLILDTGERREDRTGTGTLSLFAPPQMRFDLREGFPLLTTKKLHIPSIVHELLFFLRGEPDIKYLAENDVKIWNADAYRDYKSKGGKLDYEGFVKTLPELGYYMGPLYPATWRGWHGITMHKGDYTECYVDQIKGLVMGLKNNPTSRRHIVSAWNVAQLDEMILNPCHVLFQCYVSNDGGLSLQMYQRSSDFFLGKPYNIASYAILTHMLAQVTGLYAKELIMVDGDAHLYLNHLDQIKEQMTREPKPLPSIKLNPDIKDINDFKYEDIILEGYNSHPLIKGAVSVGT